MYFMAKFKHDQKVLFLSITSIQSVTKIRSHGVHWIRCGICFLYAMCG